MEDAQREAIINSLFLMAWKDGEVAAEEKSILDRLLFRLGVPRAQVMEIINERTQTAPGPDSLEVALPDHESRLQVMKMLIAVCFADGKLAMEELDYLYQLAVKLEIRADELDDLRIEAEQMLDPSLRPVALPGQAESGSGRFKKEQLQPQEPPQPVRRKISLD